MSRVGWVVLGLIVVAAAAFASMLSFGGAGGMGHRAAPAVRRFPPMATALRPDGLPELAVPVAGVERGAVTDTWGQARGEGRVHHGTDIPAPQDAPVTAAAAGTIEKLFQSRLGGTTLYERSADRRWTFYYAHLSRYAPGLAEGDVVRTGQVLAYVGDSGDAEHGDYHLHFGLTRTTPDQHWYQGEDVNAYPSLAGTAARR